MALDAIAAAGEAAFVRDTITNRAFLFVWPAAVAIGVIRMVKATRSGSTDPPLAAGLAGITLGFMGGRSRVTSFSDSQLATDLPAGVNRVVAVACIAVGFTLVTHFGWHLWRYPAARLAAIETRPVNAAEVRP